MVAIHVASNMDKLLAGAKLEQQAIGKAAQRALNTAARGLKTDTSRELRKRYPKLRAKDIAEKIHISFAAEGGYDMKAIISVRGRPLTVTRFMTGQITKRGKGGVWVSIAGQRKFLPHAWVRTAKNKAGDDYTLVWWRIGAGRNAAIEPVKTIDFANAANIREVRDILDKLVVDRFDKEFARQIIIRSR